MYFLQVCLTRDHVTFLTVKLMSDRDALLKKMHLTTEIETVFLFNQEENLSQACLTNYTKENRLEAAKFNGRF